MKKTIIALLALGGVAMAESTTTSYTWDATNTAYLGGTKSGELTTGDYTPNQGVYAGEELSVITGSTYQENETKTLYNWINDAIAGKSTFVMEGAVAVGSSTSGTTILHVGRADYGLTLGIKAGSLVLTNANVGAPDAITLGSFSINSSNSDKWHMTDFSVSIGKGGVVTYSIGNAVAQQSATKFTKNWYTGTADLGEAENFRYSIGFKAPGWSGNDALSTTNMLKGLTVSSVPVASVPEPTTATLSLLALAGLAARRRRK